MRRLQLAALFGALMLAAPAAFAADIVRPLPPVAPPPPGGWYLRLDGGYKWYNNPSVIFDAPSYGAGFPVPGDGELFDETMGPAWNVGAGFGYDPAGPHRFDFTLDYESPSHFHGHLTCTVCVGPTFSNETADISAWTGLANVYVDLGPHGNVTPYIGGGFGFSYLTTSGVASDQPPDSHYAGASHWNFAWSLTAGISKDIAPGLKLDVNYRYLNLGEARSGILDDGTGNTGYFQYQNISANEFRIGLRHQL